MPCRAGVGLIASLATIVFVAVGATISAIGLYFDPIRTSFGWSSGQVSGIASTFMVALSCCTLVAGWLLDRLGARIVMALATLLAGIGYLYASVAPGGIGVLIGFAIAGAGIGGGGYLSAMFVLARRLSDGLGLAIGIVLAAASAGSAILPPLIAHLITLLGWRSALACTGGLLCLANIPLVLLTVPGRTGSGHAAAGTEARPTERTSLVDDLLSPIFWAICAIQALFFLGFMGLYFHIIPFLAGIGYPPELGATLFGAANAISAAALIMIGWIAERYGARLILAICLLVYAASLLLLDRLGGSGALSTSLILFIVLWGATQGAPTQLVPLLLARAIGVRNFGTLNGIAGAVQGVANALGPLLIGVIKDRTGSYLSAFHLCAALTVIAIVPLLVTASRPKVASRNYSV